MPHRIETQAEQWPRQVLRMRFALSDMEFGAHERHVQDALDQAAEQGIDSRHLEGSGYFRDGSVRWKPERRAQHRQLLHDLWYDQANRVPREGKAMVMGGLGGAGKGKIQRDPNQGLNVDNYMVLDPDQIKTAMAARGMIPKLDALSPMEASPLVHEEASALAKRLARIAMRKKTNLLWDYTMSGDQGVQKRVDDLRKHGYGQVDAAFVDSDPQRAFERAKKRHRHGEEDFREKGVGFGGRVVPETVSTSNAPTPGSGFMSRNAEVFNRNRHLFDNSAVWDVRGPAPVITSVTGARWAGPQWQAPPGVKAARRRYAAMPTVRELLERYEQGAVGFPELLQMLAAHEYVERPQLHGWAEVYHHAEQMPEDDDMFWLYSAEDLGILTENQLEQILDAIEPQEGDHDIQTVDPG